MNGYGSESEQENEQLEMKKKSQYSVYISLGQRGKKATKVGFEPTRAEHNGLAVHRLNHSATSSADSQIDICNNLNHISSSGILHTEKSERHEPGGSKLQCDITDQTY